MSCYVEGKNLGTLRGHIDFGPICLTSDINAINLNYVSVNHVICLYYFLIESELIRIIFVLFLNIIFY